MQKISLKKGDFEFRIKLAGDGTDHLSSEVVLGDVPWKIKIRERNDGNEMVIDGTLMCSSPKELKADQQWTCEVMAKISVCSLDTNRQFNEKTIPRTQFGNKSLSCRPVEIIRFASSLLYKKNDWLVFNVEVLLNPIFYQSSAEIDHQLVKFKFTVENVSQLGSKNSSDMKMRGSIWNIHARRHGTQLGIFLCHKSYYLNVNWSWTVQCSFKLLSFDGNVEPITQNVSKNFQFDVPDWGFSKFVEWDELMDPEKKFVENDIAVFEIDLKVDTPRPQWDFGQPPPVKAKSSECSICLQDIVDRAPASTKCGHIFCNPCIRRSVDQHQKCPNCNADAKLEDIRPIFL